MFEIKYDRDGTPIREKSRLDEYSKQADAVVPPVTTQHFPETEQEHVEEPQEETSTSYVAA